MRTKVLASALAVALAIVAAAVCLRYAPSAPPPSPPVTGVSASENAGSAPPSASVVMRRAQIARVAVAAPPLSESRAELATPDHADYVLERKAQLLDLIGSNDPSALRTILSELNNQDPEIRKAALSAAVQVGNPEAIPALRNELLWAEDPQEKVQIQEAIDFLQLPPADQVKNEAVAAQAARDTEASVNN